LLSSLKTAAWHVEIQADYSREAALRGIGSLRPWRVLSWLDTALQN